MRHISVSSITTISSSPTSVLSKTAQVLLHYLQEPEDNMSYGTASLRIVLQSSFTMPLHSGGQPQKLLPAFAPFLNAGCG